MKLNNANNSKSSPRVTKGGTKAPIRSVIRKQKKGRPPIKAFGITLRKGVSGDSGGTSVMKVEPITQKREGIKFFGLTIGGSKNSKEVLAPTDPETFVFKTTLPKINVIPHRVTEKYEIKGVLRTIFTNGIGVVALFGLVFVLGNSYSQMLTEQEEIISASEQTLSDEVNALTPYEQFRTAVAAKKTTLGGEVASDVDMSVIYSDIRSAAENSNITLSSIIVSQQSDETGLEQSTCLSPDPFNATANVAGCIVISGRSEDPQASQNFIDTLVTLSSPAKYVSPFIGGVTTSPEGEAVFEANLSFTTELFTSQYREVSTPIDDILNNMPVDEIVIDDGSTDEEIQYSSNITLTVQVVLPDLSQEGLSAIEEVALNICSSPNRETNLETIETIVGEEVTDETIYDDAVAILSDAVVQECDRE